MLSIFNKQIQLRNFRYDTRLPQLGETNTIHKETLRLFRRKGKDRTIRTTTISRLRTQYNGGKGSLSLEYARLKRGEHGDYLLHNLVQRKEISHLNHLVRLLYPINNFSIVNGKATVAVAFRTSSAVLHSRRRQGVNFNLTIQGLTKRSSMPIVFTRRLRREKGRLRGILLKTITNEKKRHYADDFFQKRLPRGVTSLAPRNRVAIFLFPMRDQRKGGGGSNRGSRYGYVLYRLSASWKRLG